jgi:hypothetical protein
MPSRRCPSASGTTALKGASDPRPMRSLLLDAGLDPLRLNFPPLFNELRQQLDPTQTLVVMEA